MRRILACVSMLLSAAPALAAMTLTSSDIQPGAPIPAAQIYSRCGGQNISPQLTWSGAPAGTKSFVLTMIDISVKPSQWSHWVVVDLPPETTSLARGMKAFPGTAKAITSNFGDANYDGPCPLAADLSSKLSRIALDRADLAGFVTR